MGKFKIGDLAVVNFNDEEVVHSIYKRLHQGIVVKIIFASNISNTYQAVAVNKGDLQIIKSSLVYYTAISVLESSLLPYKEGDDVG